jgi:hypothetical protein
LPADVRIVRIPQGLADIIKVFGDNPAAWRQLKELRDRLRDGPLVAAHQFGGSRHHGHPELEKLRERFGGPPGSRDRDEEVGRSGMLRGMPGRLSSPFKDPSGRVSVDGWNTMYAGRSTPSGGTASYHRNKDTGDSMSIHVRPIPERGGGGTYRNVVVRHRDGSEDRTEIYHNADGSQREIWVTNYSAPRRDKGQDGSDVLVRDYTGVVVSQTNPDGRLNMGTDVVATAREADHDPQYQEPPPKDSQPGDERGGRAGNDNCGWRPFLGCTQTWAAHNPAPGGDPGREGPDGRTSPAAVVGSNTSPGPGAATDPNPVEGASGPSGGGPFSPPGPGPDPGRGAPDGPTPPTPR